MFTINETNFLLLNGYLLIESSPFIIVVQSKQSQHYWKIMSTEISGINKFVLFHSHHGNNDYHQHKVYDTLEDVFDEMKRHDIYQVEKRSRENHRYDNYNY